MRSLTESTMEIMKRLFKFILNVDYQNPTGLEYDTFYTFHDVDPK